MKSDAKSPVTKSAETDISKTARLGPSRKIVSFRKKGKTTQIAVLECKHERTAHTVHRIVRSTATYSDDGRVSGVIDYTWSCSATGCGCPAYSGRRS